MRVTPWYRGRRAPVVGGVGLADGLWPTIDSYRLHASA
jgi:hypothetical protein